MVHSYTWEEGLTRILDIIIEKQKKKRQDYLFLVSGSEGCLSHDTRLFGQDKSIGELYNEGKHYVKTYSLKTRTDTYGKYLVQSLSEIIPSGIKEVFEIELENGKKVYATKEHKLFLSKHYSEKILEDIKLGDELICYPENKINEYYTTMNEKRKKNTRTKFSQSKICRRCSNLYYHESECKRGVKELYCNHCKEESKVKFNMKKDTWFLWEDNVLKTFWSSTKTNEFIQELLSHRVWSGILHRAARLGLKRNKSERYKNCNFLYQYGKNNPIHIPEIKAKAIAGYKVYMQNNPDKMLNFQLRRNHMTKIERKIKDFLDSKGINYDYNKVVRTRTTFRFPDFKIGNLIIECDGNYWHKGKEHIDNARQKELEEIGFKVLRFNDSQIINDFDEVEKCIVQELNQ
jgi:very-short-patch-repair endonuclease